MTREQIEKAIAEISKQMSGPLPDIERRLLHEDRKDLRAMLDVITPGLRGAAKTESQSAVVQDSFDKAKKEGLL